MSQSSAKKILKKQQEEKKKLMDERNKKIKAFFEEYKELCENMKLQIDGLLEKRRRGLKAKMKIAPYYEEDIKVKHKIPFMILHAIKSAFVIFRRKKFMTEYLTICRAHRLQFNIQLDITDEGIGPRMSIANYQPKPSGGEVKEWKEAQAENKVNAKLAEADRKTLSEDEFKIKWPDRPYKLDDKKNGK